MTKSIHIRSAPLGAIRAFEAAARLGSFKLAALELSVTPAAISHQLAALEGYLGTALFIRSNRLVQLTSKGQQLSEQVTASFTKLQHALEQACVLDTDNQVLVVSAAPSIAAKWLVPRLSRFHARHPEIDLRLSSENQTHELIKDTHVDVVLRYGKGGYDNNSALHAERLWEETYLFPVCSPATLRASVTDINCLADLATQILLRLPSPPDRHTGIVEERWQAWLGVLSHETGSESVTLPNQEQTSTLLEQIKKGPFYSHEHLAIDVAKAGHGFCLALDVLVIEDLLTQQLIRPLPIRSRDTYAHWLLYREQDSNLPKIQAFVNWIRDEARASLQTLSTCRSRALA